MTDFLLLLKILIACNPYHSKVISEHTKYLQFTKALFSLKLPKQNPVSLNQLPIKFVAWWKIKKALIEGFLIKTFWQFLVGIRCLFLFYYYRSVKLSRCANALTFVRVYFGLWPTWYIQFLTIRSYQLYCFAS